MPVPRRPTIIDVARAAGVSKSTVSLVLQGSGLVKEATREVVTAAMSQLGYVYNRAAANLRTSNVGLIGMVINDLRNPYFTEFAASAQMALSARGYATVIANTDEDPAIQTQVVASMIEHGISALVISPTYGDDGMAFTLLERAGIPVLQVLRKGSDNSAHPFASFDFHTGGRLATRHLLDQGLRRIAFVGGLEERPVTLERLAGYHEEMAAAGLPPFALYGRPSRRFGREVLDRLLAALPDCEAVLCFNDQVALGLHAACAASGRRPGTDLRLIGFDDIEECALAFPQLSSVRCNIADFGRQTAESLLGWLEEGTVPPAETRAPVSLIPRASSLGPA
jgi:LacI family transcriptional regulator